MRRHPIAPPAPLALPAVEPTARWVRVRFGGQIIADSRNALLLRQYASEALLPTYYFPQRDVRMESLVTEAGADQDGLGWRTVTIGDRRARDAAWIVNSSPHEQLAGHVGFRWEKMDAWYEEEEEIFVHARDPRQRVDVLPSSRHVKVVIAGETVAETRRPHLLFETTLPTRYYLPREDVRLDLLEPTGLRTRCPYKGQARYFSARIGAQLKHNIVWSYPEPIAECPKIRGLLCFFNEHVDLYVDGERQVRPQTPWSSTKIDD